MSQLIQIEPEYIYVTIPAEYICVYHRILAMMADYGEEMLKDCKANCTDRNSSIIECFNMFNSAIAARKLGKDKLAETIILYIKAKINQIYRGKDNSTSFVFPVDENGQLKAFVSCGERPKFEINPDDGDLYEHKFNNGFDEHFKLGIEDNSPDGEASSPSSPVEEIGLSISFVPRYELDKDGNNVPCGDLYVYFDGKQIDIDLVDVDYYFDDKQVLRFDDVKLTKYDVGIHNFKVVVNYNRETKIANTSLMFNIYN